MDQVHDDGDIDLEDDEDIDEEFLDPSVKVERFLTRSTMHPFEALAEPVRRRSRSTCVS